jgi:hypothetical protein
MLLIYRMGQTVCRNHASHKGEILRTKKKKMEKSEKSLWKPWATHWLLPMFRLSRMSALKFIEFQNQRYELLTKLYFEVNRYIFRYLFSQLEFNNQNSD